MGSRLSAFLDGELEDSGAQRVRAHLSRCAACAAR
ncbi:MAG: zf-HC2 domain-containing protein, partial [Planctomycetes bacterium]|nr:zf-HC2 domain-containing protein [Planctomycetota bacterium]